MYIVYVSSSYGQQDFGTLKRNLTWLVSLTVYPSEISTIYHCSMSRVTIKQCSTILCVACFLPVPTDITSLTKYSVNHCRSVGECPGFGPQWLRCRAKAVEPTLLVAKLNNHPFQTSFVLNTVNAGWSLTHKIWIVTVSHILPRCFINAMTSHYYLHCMSTCGGKGHIGELFESTEAWMVLRDDRNIINYAPNSHS